MNAKSKASQTYLRNAVLTATPEQLQLMLYDGAIKYAQQGRTALQEQNFEAAFHAFDRAQRIVLQLHAGLKREINPEYVDRVGAVCDFIYRRLIDANAFQDLPAIDDALRLLREERDTWQLVMEKISTVQTAGTAPPPPTAAAAPPAQKLPVAARITPTTPASANPAPSEPLLSLEG